MLSDSAIREIIEQLRSADEADESPYLGFFADAQREEYWHIEANRAGLRKYAAELLGASVYKPASTGDSPQAPLESSWLDQTGFVTPLFVQFVEAPNVKPQVEHAEGVMDKVFKFGCLAVLVAFLGVFVAGIKEIIDLLNA